MFSSVEEISSRRQIFLAMVMWMQMLGQRFEFLLGCGSVFARCPLGCSGQRSVPISKDEAIVLILSPFLIILCAVWHYPISLSCLTFLLSPACFPRPGALKQDMLQGTTLIPAGQIWRGTPSAANCESARKSLWFVHKNVMWHSRSLPA